jgi:hypothetical protein
MAQGWVAEAVMTERDHLDCHAASISFSQSELVSDSTQRTKPLARPVACGGRRNKVDGMIGRPVLRLRGFTHSRREHPQ